VRSHNLGGGGGAPFHGEGLKKAPDRPARPPAPKEVAGSAQNPHFPKLAAGAHNTMCALRQFWKMQGLAVFRPPGAAPRFSG